MQLADRKYQFNLLCVCVEMSYFEDNDVRDLQMADESATNAPYNRTPDDVFKQLKEHILVLF